MIHHIDQYDEEILLVFWGDHLPGIYSNAIGEKNSALTRRETPLFFYSNMDDLYGSVDTISPIYYLNHVLDILNIKVTPFEALLMELEERLPGLYGGLYLEDTSKAPLESRNNLNVETKELLDKYSLIQYDMVSGSGFSREVGFFDITE